MTTSAWSDAAEVLAADPILESTGAGRRAVLTRGLPLQSNGTIP
ncbi:hypothetical protein [Streptomyces mirabilis]